MANKDVRQAEKGFIDKMKKFAGIVPFAKEAVELYYCMIDENTPNTVKVACAAPLVYFISPFDAVPDMIPVVGLGDDAGVVLGAYQIVKNHITEEHTKKMKEFLLIDETTGTHKASSEKAGGSKFSNPEAALSLVSYLAHIDGLDEDDEELVFIKEAIDSETENIDIKKYNNILQNPPSFKSLTQKLKAATKDKENIKRLISGIILADNKITFNEEVAALKISLFLEGSGNVPIYKIYDDENDCPQGDIREILTCLSKEQAQEKFTFTKKISCEEMYLEHPDDDKILVTPSYLFSSSTKDKITEILEAMGKVGAKKVTIKKQLHGRSQSQIQVEGSISTPIKAMGVDCDANFVSNKLHNSQEEQEYKIEFEEPPKRLLDKLLSSQKQDAMDFLTQSNYIKNDDKLTMIFKSRLSPNKAKSFSYTLNEQKSSEFKKSFQNSLKIIGAENFNLGTSVKIEHKKEENNIFNYSFEVEFYPSC